jgi:hypothetical protein
MQHCIIRSTQTKQLIQHLNINSWTIHYQLCWYNHMAYSGRFYVFGITLEVSHDQLIIP